MQTAFSGPLADYPSLLTRNPILRAIARDVNGKSEVHRGR